MEENAKESNPKDTISLSKVPMSLFPPAAIAEGAMALLDGGLKYNFYNYRAIGVRASVYVDAALRHIYAYSEGEDRASDSKVNHLGHALACLAILIDAKAVGKLNDDRGIAGGFREVIEEITPNIQYLRELHKSKESKKYILNGSLE